MTNFEKITENESALVDWLRGRISCCKCPVQLVCAKESCGFNRGRK